MRLRLILAIATVATAAACASVPEVTFEDADAATDAGGVTSSDATAGDSGGTGAGGKEAGTPISDAGNTNDGSVSTTADAAACGGSTGDICCGTQICHNCILADCPNCTGLACTAGKVCCAKSMSVTCHALGPGC